MRAFLCIIALFSANLALAQARTGIYITSNEDIETCANKFKLLNANQLFCLHQEPILEPDSFESVGAIAYDSVFKMQRFKLRLTPLGAKHINAIATRLPTYKLAIVVDGILVSALNLEGIYQARVIEIWDEYDSHAMEWIHKSLTDKVNKGSKKI